MKPVFQELNLRLIFTLRPEFSEVCIYGLVNLTRTYGKDDIDTACGRVLAAGHISYRAIKAILKRTAKVREVPQRDLRQQGPEIRPASDYQLFWDINARTNKEETYDGNVHS